VIGRGVAALLLACAACGGPAHLDAGDSLAHAGGDPMPTIKSGDDIASHDDQQVEVVGTYKVQDLGRYRIVSVTASGEKIQSNQLAYVELDDGKNVRLGARPDDELEQRKNQRVRATGRLKAAWPPRQPDHVAQPDPAPTLIEISAVASE
jgi:hypothetical protein